MEDNLNVH